MNRWFRSKEERSRANILSCVQATLDSISKVHLGKIRQYVVCCPFDHEFVILDDHGFVARMLVAEFEDCLLTTDCPAIYDSIARLLPQPPSTDQEVER